MQAKPLRKQVLVKAYEWPEKMKSGLYMPNMMKYSSSSGGKDPWRGKVLAIGKKVEQVKVGEIVRYQPGNYYRFTVEEDGVRYIFLEEQLIYAVEDENEVLIRALKNRVVFLPDPMLEKKYGSLYLPQNREEKFLWGTIVVAGKGSGVEKGDRVVFENKKTFQYYDSDGKRFIITDRENLLVKVNDT